MAHSKPEVEASRAYPHDSSSPMGTQPPQRNKLQPQSSGKATDLGTGVGIQVPQFDPVKHLAFQVPKTLMMSDLGFADDVGVSPVAVTYPFQLFTREATQIMRSEVLKPEVRESCTFSSNIAANQLRGYAKEHAPFTYAAWRHPKTHAIVSKLAGVDLIPWSDYEIAHINLSVKTEEQAQAEREAHNAQRLHEGEGSAQGTEKDKPVVGWHTDSYPFVCVLMLSDCTDMIGGETAIRTAKGDVIRVRGPTEGCAIILQGRYITHQALRALGAKERITAVTSWRPRSPFLKDDSVLRTVRPVSDLNELYYDFAEYRLKMIEERSRREYEELRARRARGEKFNTLEHKAFLGAMADFMNHTNREIVEEWMVPKGYIETIDVPDVVVGV